MKDRAEQSLEQKLFEMAEREEMILPDTLQDRMDDILVRLTKRRKYRMTWRKSWKPGALIRFMQRCGRMWMPHSSKR